METQMIDMLFLELSQFSNAKTERELSLERLLCAVLEAWVKDGVSNKEGHRQLYNRAYRIANKSLTTKGAGF